MSGIDYGILNEAGADSRITPVKQTQVYQATHTGGGLRLPFMNRSFISFTYGGKHIEDFNLIATISGDRLEKTGYSSFEDIVSTYDNLDGQHYWGTHYRGNLLDLTLSTDGIDQRTLDDFLYWFKPGTIRELILSEHPNRAIMARISLPPQINLLPFESDVTVVISDVSYTTKTTLFKGEISISFTMDKPHWYSLKNIIGILNGDKYEDKWVDDNGLTWDIIASQDALKILYEDGIPLGSMIDDSMILGNNVYANAATDVRSLIWDTVRNEGARIDPGDGSLGFISGAIMEITGNGISLLPQYSSDADMGYFFYSGTAPSPTIITFTLNPVLDGDQYVSSPLNSFSYANAAYNTFTIGSLHEQQLKFTAPSLYISYNKAISIFREKAQSQYSWEDVREAIRDNVRHTVARQWATKIVNYMQKKIDNSDVILNTYGSRMSNLMSYMLKNLSDRTVMPVTFTFNSDTGEATGKFSYRLPTSGIPENDAAWATYGTLRENLIEDTGDMLRSNYIIILDRNYPTADSGKVIKWADTSSTTRQYSHYIKHDVSGGLTNVQIRYKNMYF